MPAVENGRFGVLAKTATGLAAAYPVDGHNFLNVTTHIFDEGLIGGILPPVEVVRESGGRSPVEYESFLELANGRLVGPKCFSPDQVDIQL